MEPTKIHFRAICPNGHVVDNYFDRKEIRIFLDEGKPIDCSCSDCGLWTLSEEGRKKLRQDLDGEGG